MCWDKRQKNRINCHDFTELIPKAMTFCVEEKSLYYVDYYQNYKNVIAVEIHKSP